MATNTPVTENTLITIKVSVSDSTKKLKLPLKDLGAGVLPAKLRTLLTITPEQDAVFERFSDSAGGYVTLDAANPAVFKTLIRAAKAKGKLRLKATITPPLDPLEKEQSDPSTSEAPVIARTPATTSSLRASTAMDPISVGTGIFKFREAMQQKTEELKLVAIASDEAPLPKPFTTSTNAESSANKALERTDFFSMLANHGVQHELALRTRASSAVPASTWSVYCNECDSGMDNVHFHCSICDGGDYDLCEQCVESGKLCPGEGHWLIKRTIADGKVIASTTERIAPKMKKQPSESSEVDAHPDIPGAFTEDTKTLNEETEGAFRTCNSCVISLPEHEFVTCRTCDDFDLCRRCHTGNKHGHHPGHHFEAAVSGTELSLAEEALLSAGRNTRHNAVCDGCDEKIFGIRHKCFSCPDYDLCSECVKDARHTHPRHRFAILYDPIPMKRLSTVRHHGVYCDGPLCNDQPNQTYIQGVRYKCAVCHDTDFCASCEALPGTFHNKTHPLVKFKTPVNHVTVSTGSEDKTGFVKQLGDREVKRESESSPVVAAASPKQTTSPVKTVADIHPTQRTKEQQQTEIKPSPSMKSIAPIVASQCNAHFVRDSVADGSVFAPNTLFTQIWTIRNPGPYTWPAGCSVRYVGGDNMLNVSSSHPTTSADMAEATETNVVGRAVYPGEEAAFKIVMKTPMRVGKAISYWRLKSADGTPFGHRLWCDITVKAAIADAPKAATEPTTAPISKSDEPLTRLMMNMPRSANVRASQACSQAEVQARGQSYYAQYQQRIQAMKSAMADRQAAVAERAKTEARAVLPSYTDLSSAAAYAAGAAPPLAMPQSSTASNQSQVGYQRELELIEMRRQRRLEEARRAAATPSAVFRGPEPSSQRESFSTNQSLKDFSMQLELLEQQNERRLKMNRERNQLAEQEQAKTKAAEAEKQETSIAAVKAEEVKAEEAVVKTEEGKQEEAEMTGSQMVFPTLDKESPASSTYQSMSSSSTASKGKGKAAYVEDEQTGVKTADAGIEPRQSEVLSTQSAADADEGFEDVSVSDDLEVLSADGDEESDDGFMTDEEYDILDASDQETVASKE